MAKNVKNKHLLKAYRDLLERTKSRLQEFEHTTVPEAIEHAKQTAILLEEVTVEEAENIVQFLQRDLESAAHYIHATEEDIKFKLMVDVDYIEDMLLQTFSHVADRTLVDKVVFDWRLKRGPIYRTGEITSMGILQCESCGTLLHFHRVSHIPPCGKCHGEEFSRVRKDID